MFIVENTEKSQNINKSHLEYDVALRTIVKIVVSTSEWQFCNQTAVLNSFSLSYLLALGHWSAFSIFSFFICKTGASRASTSQEWWWGLNKETLSKW